MKLGRRDRVWMVAIGAVALVQLWVAGENAVQLAYIGPGAGFAFLGSFLTLIAGFFVSAAAMLTWPVRMLYRLVKRRGGLMQAKARKVIFLGLDGFDPVLAEQFLKDGKLPNLQRLQQAGGYARLRTTFPPLSPVAWSSFATGVSPARHAMFDFLNRNLKSYLPELSSAAVRPPRRVLKLGKYRIPLGAPVVELRRKSKAFWHLLGEHFIPCTVLRVPITFPPENFQGQMLSAMCTPDLLGTQGTFSFFTTQMVEGEMESGNRFPLVREGAGWKGTIEGPANGLVEGGGPLQIPFRIEPEKKGGWRLVIGRKRHALVENEYTPWIRLEFRAGLGTVSGISRFLFKQDGREATLYVTPVNIDPENPALPISHPARYSNYLAKLIGSYATLGMAEDTWALNEKAIDEDAFLAQAYLTFEERKAMFASALERTRRGMVACVFDTTDRVQHMFHRDMRKGGRHQQVIEELYRKADALVGETMGHVDEHTVLFVLSDHGFASFDRGVNLNTWLLENGYLALKEDAKGKGYLQDIDWSRTKAYTFGLAGLYINQKGREAEGIVPKSEAEALRKELAAKLTGLMDGERDTVAIRRAWPSGALYRGPYLEAAPDVIVGYADGYRASWDAAVGKVSDRVVTDNSKAWSGDHCIDPHLVPGVLYCNRTFAAGDPGIEDMAATALDLFGVPRPAWMEGRSIFGPQAGEKASREEAA